MNEITEIILAKDWFQNLFSLTAGQGFSIHVSKKRPNSENKLFSFFVPLHFKYCQTTSYMIKKSHLGINQVFQISLLYNSPILTLVKQLALSKKLGKIVLHKERLEQIDNDAKKKTIMKGQVAS